MLPSSKDLYGEIKSREGTPIEKEENLGHLSGEEDSMFAAETASLLDLFPELSKEGTEVFKTSFHDFSVNCGIPIAAILVSKQKNCRMCKKPLLLLDNEWKKTV